MPIESIFFDTSDTLYHCRDFENAQSEQPIKQLAEIRDLEPEEAKELFKQTKLKLQAKSPGTKITKVAVMMGLGISRTDFHDYLARLDAKQYLEPDERLKSILYDLRSTYSLGIITNVNNKLLASTLDSLGIPKSYFPYVVSVDNTENSKPHQEPFLTAVKLVNVKPQNCVYVGDSLKKDMIPAKKAGMKTIWMTNKNEDHSAVDCKIDSIYNIKDVLTQL